MLLGRLSKQASNNNITGGCLFCSPQSQNTFVMALDGDTDFSPGSVHILLDRMKKNPKVGAACGRIHPIGSGGSCDRDFSPISACGASVCVETAVKEMVLVCFGEKKEGTAAVSENTDVTFFFRGFCCCCSSVI